MPPPWNLAEHLLGTADHLDEQGVRERYVEDLAARLRDRRDRSPG